MKKQKRAKKERTPQETLANVLSNWVEFCRTHKPLAIAIEAIIAENQALKEENKRLKNRK